MSDMVVDVRRVLEESTSPEVQVQAIDAAYNNNTILYLFYSALHSLTVAEN
jgi:hypothetical protein